jgi:hypothetical protein
MNARKQQLDPRTSQEPLERRSAIHAKVSRAALLFRRNSARSDK